MARIMVLQHVAAEPLGLLDPMIRARGHRIRYVNFQRDPHASPDLSQYDALVVLGGPMQVTDTHLHPHLKTEFRLIEQALALRIPVLGICLGAQLLAHVLGARVGPASRPEIGWHRIRMLAPAATDPVLHPMAADQAVFQWHSYGFEIPSGAVHLAESDDCPGQALAYDDVAWGFQFHLELDEHLIRRWMNSPHYLADLAASGLEQTPRRILEETRHFLADTRILAERVFGNWLARLGAGSTQRVLPSR